jgi:hypothetical protein
MAELKESKEKLPISFLTDFVSRSWDDVGYLKETIASIKESFSGTKKVEELLQALVDAYLVCIGQLEAHLQAKDYLDTDIDNKLTEDVDIHIEGNEVHIADDSGEEVAIIPVEPAAEEAPVECEGPECEVPPVEVEMPVVTEPTEEPIAADDGEFNAPFEFDAPEAEGVRKFEKPEVADFFVDFDDPVGEPVTEKELYGEGEEPIEGEKIDADVEEEE